MGVPLGTEKTQRLGWAAALIQFKSSPGFLLHSQGSKLLDEVPPKVLCGHDIPSLSPLNKA